MHTGAATHPITHEDQEHTGPVLHLAPPPASPAVEAAVELRRWYTLLGVPFLLAAIFFMTTIATGHLWLLAGSLVTGPGLLIMAFVYLGLSSDTNSLP